MRLLPTLAFAAVCAVTAPIGPVVTPAHAQESGSATIDPAPLQSVIRSQLEAFRRDDGATAYSYAAPNIRQVFTTPDIFMAMVRTGYPPVYRPRSYTFGELKQQDGRWVQTVEIVGPDGDYWTAAYTLVQQPDGTWKIAACIVIKAPGSSA